VRRRRPTLRDVVVRQGEGVWVAGWLEVEVKYRVTGDVAAVLVAQGIVLSDPVGQEDQAYAPGSWRFGDDKQGVPFARLRTQHGRHLFTVKRPAGDAMACVEHETQVSDREQMHLALLAMGFWPTVRIVKTRRSGRRGDITVCLDQVDGLGQFLEMETMAAVGEDWAAVQTRLDTVARSLGVSITERIVDTYDALVRQAAPAG
jgi:adenylate cyclase class 2